MEHYGLIKLIHQSSAALSLSLFVLRAALLNCKIPVSTGNNLIQVIPHVVDTILLTSAVALAVMARQAPFVDHWLTAKVVALLVYIALGSLALKRARTLAGRLLSLSLALATFGYIVWVAFTKNPAPWL
ncbi:SirB2 family protein [Methylonatrum kenyense]|uniref:SirB2 family protein n=1 Tax=Methylonatrum kenyense TaxID=455253 RepID=UPI0020BEC690|nr:SirB2 family protein [Methylonatrum kenyense]MCK8515811.1 SirB2 family protein [Methylonatrum kenyense]